MTSALCSCILSVIVGAPSLLAQPSSPPPGGSAIGLSPAKTEVDLSRDDFSFSILVFNRGGSERRVHIDVAGLGHDLDGRDLLLQPSLASEALSLSSRDVTLEPHGERQIDVRGQIPRGSMGLYAAVVASTPTSDGSDTAVSTVLLRRPGPWEESLVVEGVGTLPVGDPESGLALYAAVANDGLVHLRPEARVLVFQRGELVASVPLEPQAVIPGFERRLLGRWTPPPHLDGRVALIGVIEGSDSARGSMELDAGKFGAATADISNLEVRDARGTEVSLLVKNTGLDEISPRVELAAKASSAAPTNASFSIESLAGGESRRVTWRPSLSPGVYKVSARLLVDGQPLDSTAIGLEVRLGAIRWVALATFETVAIGLFLWAVGEHRRRRAVPDVQKLKASADNSTTSS